MSKIFDIDFRKGSLINTVGIGTLSNSGGKIIESDKGMSYVGNGSSARITITDFPYTDIGTFEAWVKPRKWEEAYLGGTYDNVNFAYGMHIGCSTNGYLFGGIYQRSPVSPTYLTVADTALVKLNTWYHIIVTFDGINMKLYINGSLISTSITISTPRVIPPDKNNIKYIGWGQMSSLGYLLGNISRIRVYDNALSQSNIYKNYQEFLNSKQIKKTTTNFIKPKPTSLSENGLVTAYNMQRQGNSIYDISGNGNTGVITGCDISINGLSFNGTSDYVTIPTSLLTGAKSFIFKFNLRSSANNQRLFYSNASLYVQTISGVLRVYHGVGTHNLPVQLGKNILIITATTSTISIWLNGIKYIDEVVYTGTNTLTANSTLGVGVGIRYMNMEMIEFRIYNKTLSTSEITKYHNSQVAPTLIETFANNGADGQTKGIQGWTIGSGTWKIGENTTNQISGLKKGDKYLECATAGVISIPSNIAYGTWEMDWYKASTANEMNLVLCAQSTAILAAPRWDNGYAVLVNAAETVILARNTVTTYSALFQSSASYIQNSTWYRIKITRTVAGIFTVYIKGGLFGNDWVLVTANTGTNPVTDTTYTTSNFFVLDLDAGDRIANIKILDGIVI